MDKITAEKRSRNMQHIRSKDTGPEITVRKLLRRLGYGYRLHGNKLPGKPDLVFSGKRKAIFIHGCFWHQHSAPECKEVHVPKSRKDYWLPKLETTKQRDAATMAKLTALGWSALIIWECQLKDTDRISEMIREFL